MELLYQPTVRFMSSIWNQIKNFEWELRGSSNVRVIWGRGAKRILVEQCPGVMKVNAFEREVNQMQDLSKVCSIVNWISPCRGNGVVNCATRINIEDEQHVMCPSQGSKTDTRNDSTTRRTIKLFRRLHKQNWTNQIISCAFRCTWIHSFLQSYGENKKQKRKYKKRKKWKLWKLTLEIKNHYVQLTCLRRDKILIQNYCFPQRKAIDQQGSAERTYSSRNPLNMFTNMPAIVSTTSW